MPETAKTRRVSELGRKSANLASSAASTSVPHIVTKPTRRDVLRRRLITQRLIGGGLPTAADVVRLLGCVQSQEYAHALWSLGMRTSGLTAAGVQAEFDRGDFLRTHILRPTWHFVAPADIRWVLELTAPRVQKLNQTIYRQHGLDQATLDRGVAVIAEELEGGQHRTRAELAQALAERGLVSQGIGLAYVVMNAELEGVICSGPVRGAQQTYALLDERVPHSADVGGDIAELARRFFLGHGPASIQDLARWSSLTIGQCRDAVEAVKDRLDCVTVEGVELWFGPRDASAEPVFRRAADASVRRGDSELSRDQFSAGKRSSTSAGCRPVRRLRDPCRDQRGSLAAYRCRAAR